MFKKSAIVLTSFLSFVVSFLLLFLSSRPTLAQITCSFVPVSTPITDLGLGEYYRLTDTDPLTYQPTGLIGGLYPFGSNIRPILHEVAGVNLAGQIQPLDTSGNPDPNGKIGMASVGMSNTSTEFGRFMDLADVDSEVNDKLVIINGAVSGATVEKWITPSDPIYNYIWDHLDQEIGWAGLVDPQVQVVWIKITQLDNSAFPEKWHNFENRLETLATLLKTKFPNLKITYFSSRTRSYAYTPGAVSEPAAFENAFGVRWLIERQINGDITLNYDPNLGTTPVSYFSWGPYLWIDGMNPRLDGRIWPITNLESDCVHPTTAGNQAVAEMLIEFFKSDSTATPWFLNEGVPTPTPTPILTPTETPTPTPSPTETPTPTPTSSPTPTSTPTPTPTSTPTPTPTPPQGGGGGLISSWTFPQDQVADDLNPCFGCVNNQATWFSPSIASGGFSFNGTSSSLNLGGFPYLDAKPSYSVSVWVKPNFNQTNSSTRYVLSDGSNFQLFFLPSADNWRTTMRNASGYTYRLNTVGLTWISGTWHLITITYNGSQFKIYWDGILSNSMSASGSMASMSNTTTLGMAGVGGSYFDGAIDELKIFDHGLSDTEVFSLFIAP